MHLCLFNWPTQFVADDVALSCQSQIPQKIARKPCVILPEPSASGPPLWPRSSLIKNKWSTPTTETDTTCFLGCKAVFELSSVFTTLSSFWLQPTSLISRLPLPPFVLFSDPCLCKMPTQSPGTWTAGWAALEKKGNHVSSDGATCCRGQGSSQCTLLHEKWKPGGVVAFSGWTVGTQRDYLCNTLRVG